MRRRGSRGQSAVEMGLVMGLVAVLSVGVLMWLGPAFAEMFADRSPSTVQNAQSKIANAVTTYNTTSTAATTTTIPTTGGTTTTTTATTTGATTTSATTTGATTTTATTTTSAATTAATTTGATTTAATTTSATTSSATTTTVGAPPCAALDILTVSFSNLGGTADNRIMNMSFTANSEVDSFTITWADESGNSGGTTLANGNNGGVSTAAVLGQSEVVNWNLTVFGCNGTLSLAYANAVSLNQNSPSLPFTVNP